MAKIKIRIKNLYKIFGDSPTTAMQHVRDGATKQDLLDDYQHVLGLKDINLNIPEKKIQVVMGLSGSGKSTLIPFTKECVPVVDLDTKKLTIEPILGLIDDSDENFNGKVTPEKNGEVKSCM